MKNNETTLDAPPWRVEPLPLEVKATMALHGWTYNDAREHLRAEMAEDAKRLAAAVPDAADEISTAIAEADAAKTRADELISQKESVLTSLENLISGLGALRSKISAVEILRLTLDGEKQLANTALEIYVQKQGAGRSPMMENAWVTSLANLTYQKALTPFLDAFLAPMRAEEKGMIANIKQLATENKIDLRKFLATLMSEQRSGRPGTKLSIDCDYHGIAE